MYILIGPVKYKLNDYPVSEQSKEALISTLHFTTSFYRLSGYGYTSLLGESEECRRTINSW